MLRRVLTVLVAVVALTGALGIVGTRSASAAGDLQSRIDAGSAYATGRGTTIAISVLDRVTGERRDNGAPAHTRIESASVMKVLIADNLLRRRDLGQIRLSATDLDDLTRMLRSSDNAPANRFWSTYGTNSIVSEVIARYGMSETGLTSNIRYWGNTLITANDMTTYYQGLLAGTGGLSAASRGFIIEQLQQSTPRGTDGDWQYFGLRDGLPQETWIGQKQGWMCCVNGSIYRHSTGFVGPDGRYVVSVLTKEPSGLGVAHIEQSITGAVARMFPEGRIDPSALVDLSSRAGAASSSSIGGRGASYFLNDRFDGEAGYVFAYGEPTDEVYVGDWDGDGVATLAVRRDNAFFLKNSTSGGYADVVFNYGDPGDFVFVGDWDGDGRDTFAVRRGNAFHVKNDTRTGAADAVIIYGDPGDTVLVGDWDGDGDDTLGVRRAATYFIRNSLTSGPSDQVFSYGNPDDVVLVGRWGADQVGDSLAIRRGITFFLQNSVDSTLADVVFSYGNPADTAFVGDWDGDGVDGIGVRR